MDVMEIRRRLLMQMIGGDDLEFIGQVTIAESRENDSTGNASAILDDYVYSLLTNYTDVNVFIVIAENNQASQYILRKMAFIGAHKNFVANTGSVLRQASNQSYSVRQISASTSSWCSQGTILKIYRMNGA